MIVIISSVGFTLILMIIICVCCMRKQKKEKVEVKGSWLIPTQEDTLKLNFRDTHGSIGLDEEDERRNHIQLII